MALLYKISLNFLDFFLKCYSGIFCGLPELCEEEIYKHLCLPQQLPRMQRLVQTFLVVRIITYIEGFMLGQKIPTEN